MTTGSTARGIQYLSDQQEQPEVIVNGNYNLQERLTAGIFNFNFAADANYTLATAPTTGGDPPEWQHAVIHASDTGAVLTTGRQVNFPTIANPYIFANDTLQELTLKTAVTGSQGRSIPADRVQSVMVTQNGNVYALGAAAILTAVT